MDTMMYHPHRHFAPLLTIWLLACTLPFACHAQTNTYDPALALRLAEVKSKVPPGFTVVPQPPFIVIGDESPDMVRQRATHTVKMTVDSLKQDYFTRDPQETIEIWLFKDSTSYTNHARLLFHDTPTSRFGYYSAADQALIMNIATGGGTLVH